MVWRKGAAEQIAKAAPGAEVVNGFNTGGLKNARYLEPLGGLNIYFGYGAGLGTSVAPSWISAS